MDESVELEDFAACPSCGWQATVGAKVNIHTCPECEETVGYDCPTCDSRVSIPNDRCSHKQPSTNYGNVEEGPVPCGCQGDCRRYLLSLGDFSRWCCETQFDVLDETEINEQ